jgi:hypothetical protein
MKPRFAFLAILVLAAAGCTAAGVSPSAATPSVSPAPTASASSSAPVVGTSGPQPPNAVLRVNDGAPSIGELGTYTWQGAGSDAPWLPGTPTRVAPGGAASVTLEAPVAIEAWSIKQAKPGGTDVGARQIAAGTGAVTFTVPAAAGTIALHVQFAGGAGDAVYFWALTPG